MIQELVFGVIKLGKVPIFLIYRPQLLHATPELEPRRSEATSENEDAELSVDASVVSTRDGSSRHRDERQIQLDTERSFVLYPVGKTNSFPIRHLHPLVTDRHSTDRST